MDKPHSRRLRIGRYSETGRIYLLTTVALDRKPVFADLASGRIVVQSMRHHHKRGLCQSLAFVVMPDHLHWLVQLGEHSTLPGLMRSLKGYTARKVNSLRNTPGQGLWQPGYHDHALRKEEDVRAVARYVVANPLRAGLAEYLGDYPLWDAAWL